MLQNLFLLLTGLIPLVLSATRQYYLIQEGKTWSDAQTYCRTYHTDLVTVETSEDLLHLQREAQTQQFSGDAWIGLWNDINSWRWSYQDEHLGNWKDWFSPQPDNYRGYETCGELLSAGWNDAPCNAQLPFLCFDVANTTVVGYIYYSTPMTWLDAQKYCRQFHTDLASVRNNIENQNIRKSLPNLLVSWMGLFRDTWKWSDQTNVSKIPWAPNKPDNAQANNNCGYISNSQAIDAPCSDIRPFFCFSKTTKTQIIKLKLKSDQKINITALKPEVLQKITLKLKENQVEDVLVTWIPQSGDLEQYHLIFNTHTLNRGDRKRQYVRVMVKSDKDLNNPEVNAAVLEQIKESLKDNGLNVTVNWRKQPAVSMFQKLTDHSPVTVSENQTCAVLIHYI